MSVNIIVFFIWLLAKFLKADNASPADRVFLSSIQNSSLDFVLKSFLLFLCFIMLMVFLWLQIKLSVKQ